MANTKTALMILAYENFRDEEYEKPKEILEKEGVKVDVASSRKGEAKSVLGKRVIVYKTLEEVNPLDYDAIIFVGGIGALEYFNSQSAWAIAKEAARANKVVGAICIAPSILANAGLLKGKKATAFPSEEENLKAKGAVYTGEAVSVDGNIVTASGPQAAGAFGLKIIELLKVK